MSGKKFISGKWRRQPPAPLPKKQKTKGLQLLQLMWQSLRSHPTIAVPLSVVAFASALIGAYSSIVGLLGGVPFPVSPSVAAPQGFFPLALETPFVITNKSAFFTIYVVAYRCEFPIVETVGRNTFQDLRMGIDKLAVIEIAPKDNAPVLCPNFVAGALDPSEILALRMRVAICSRHRPLEMPTVSRSQLLTWNFGSWAEGNFLTEPPLPYPFALAPGYSDPPDDDDSWCGTGRVK